VGNDKVCVLFLVDYINLNTAHRLWVDLVTDSLTEYAYDAELAGLTYQVSSNHRGVFVVLSGYNDKLPLLGERVFERLRTLKVRADRLQVVREQTKREWENFFLGQSHSISNYSASYLLAENQWTILERLKEIPSTCARDLNCARCS
jgi:insulysin